MNYVVASAADEPLNIVVLFADDWRHDTLGIEGHTVVQTPELDRLSKQGIRFTQNYVTTSICGVSRASLFTGQWMARHKNRGFGPWATPWTETYPGLLRANGYHVGHVGKWHNGKFPKERFDFGRVYGSTHWLDQADGSKIHVTRKNELDALEFLETRPTEQPFCLTVAFFATHAEDRNPKQFLPQPSSAMLYADIEIPVPKTATETAYRALPEFLQNSKNEGRIRWHWRFDTPEKYQRMMKNYYRLATEVDATCGRIIEELKVQGVLENTLIIFTTDNGYYHGEHGLADKWYPHSESIRVPLIIYDPRMQSTQAGQTRDAMTLNVDVAPTILKAAMLLPPKNMQGSDIASLYLDENPQEWRNDFYYEHPTISNIDRIPSSEALVNKEWKYFYWPDYEHEQLFHLTEDPHETKDLAQLPKFLDQLNLMRARFKQLKEAAQ